jgi:hypothetical protein
MPPKKNVEATMTDISPRQYDAILAKLSIFNTVTEKLEASEAMPTKIAPS